MEICVFVTEEHRANGLMRVKSQEVIAIALEHLAMPLLSSSAVLGVEKRVGGRGSLNSTQAVSS